MSHLLQEKSRNPCGGGGKGIKKARMKLIDENSWAPECSQLSAPVGTYRHEVFPTEEGSISPSFEKAHFPGQ